MIASDPATQQASVIIVGTGPAGIRCARELLRRDPSTAIAIYGDEPWEPYNRVRLSGLLAGKQHWGAMGNCLEIPDDANVVQHHNCAIVAIDRMAGTVTDITGQVRRYSKLVLAVGSRPRIPKISGIDKPGVFTFRDMNDAQHLLARQARTRHTVVLGGGLLGLEAAYALRRGNTKVTVVQQTPRLMDRQLDDAAAQHLHEHILSLGVDVILNDRVQQVTGAQSVTAVRLRSGREIDCDTIVLATGILPNIELARSANLVFGRGIVVSDHMQTSDPNIYAIGECAEHRKQVYGLVGPGLEQAGVAAHSILGGQSRYAGSIVAARLKVVGKPIFSMGRVGEEENPVDLRSVCYTSRADGKPYRKLVLRRSRIVGAIAVDDWSELNRVQEAIIEQRWLWPWQLLRFRRSGQLWRETATQSVNNWPATATVCQCTGVTRGVLGRAISDGCKSIKRLAECTGASTVCGSCKPLLAELVGTQATGETVRTSQALLSVSMLALTLAAIVAWAAPLPFSLSVQAAWRLDTLWLDGFWKQVSGFTLLGLSAIGLLMSLRKRVRRFTLGSFNGFRFFHAILGLSMIGVLILHTGMHLGEQLNLLLMTSFLALSLTGALAGAVAAVEGSLSMTAARRLRTFWNRMHLFIAWPLPLLLGFHITSVYYF